MSLGVTICHPCPRTNHRRPAGVTICRPRKPRPGVTTTPAVTSPASKGDSPVTRTILEPSRERSSSPAVDAARGGVGLASNGGGAATPTAAALEVLPGSVRGHPSVIPTAVAARVRILVERGWPISEVGARMTGVETADAPGAAALARLDSLQELDPPPSRPPRPQWCGHCDQRTRMREDVDRDDRPYPCPACHSRPATTCGKAVERPA